MTDFSYQFRIIIIHYNCIVYNLNVMRKSVCLFFNPVTVNNYAALINCTPDGLKLFILVGLLGPELFRLLLGPPGFNR